MRNQSYLSRNMLRLVVPVLAIFISGCSFEKFGCNATGTLNIESFSQSGEMVVGLRQGNRPGSLLVDAGNLQVGEKLTFSRICSGRYFFSFGKPDSKSVFVTDYYDVRPNIKSFEITIRVVHGSASNAPVLIKATAL